MHHPYKTAAAAVAILLLASAAGARAGVVEAVKAHDLTALATALQKDGANAQDSDGTTALMLAVQARNPAMVKALLDAGADVAATNRYGATALHTAARNGDASIAEQLLAGGADPATALPEGETVLMAAAKTGNTELVKALLAGKADPNAKESWKGQTALMWAAAGGHADTVRALIAGGARLDEFSTEIAVPAVNPDRRIGGFVYANIPRGRMTAMHFAARAGHLEVVRALIEAKASLDLVDADGTNALVLATLNGHPQIAIDLLNAGADPNVADKYGRTVLFNAIDMNTLDANPRPAPQMTGDATYLDVAQLAIARGANVNATLKTSLPSWVAQGGGHNPILREGATAFLRASMSGDLKAIELLLKAGADPMLATAGEKLKPYSEGGPDRENFGATTPLQVAAGVGWREEVSRGRDQDAIETLKLLLARGGKVNEPNMGGNTPLHGAAFRGSPAIVQFLLEQGADPTVKNARGLTALDIAVGQPDYRILPNEAVARVLRNFGSQRLSRN